MKHAVDDLSKALASGMSRREAIKRFGIAAAGAAFAVLLPARARAAGPSPQQGIHDCNAFCNFLYGQGTPNAKHCIKQANHGKGACFQTGPASHACHAVHCPTGSICVSGNLNMNGTGQHAHCVPV